MCECHLGQIPLSIVHQGYRISKKCQGESLVHFVSQLPLNSPPLPKKSALPVPTTDVIGADCAPLMVDYYWDVKDQLLC